MGTYEFVFVEVEFLGLVGVGRLYVSYGMAGGKRR